jgi:hypothetical protein
MNKNFPWGDRNPKDGYKVEDCVGIIHSDHENYLFDNPTGKVIKTAKDMVIVQIEVEVPKDKMYLIERNGKLFSKKEDQ